MTGLYLTDWYTVPTNPGTQHLIVYDGIEWGFDIKCVPEPSTILGVARSVT